MLPTNLNRVGLLPSLGILNLEILFSFSPARCQQKLTFVRFSIRNEVTYILDLSSLFFGENLKQKLKILNRNSSG